MPRPLPLARLAFALALFLGLVHPGTELAAQTAGRAGEVAGYITYSPRDVPTRLAFSGEDLEWLTDVAALLAPGDFTLLRRVDPSHWSALTRLEGRWLLQIHDEEAYFNFRGLVDAASGRITVQRGVDLVGSGREDDAARAAVLAMEYIRRMRADQPVFLGVQAGFVREPGAEAWNRLLEGNRRFAAGAPIHPDQERSRLLEVAGAQRPFAVVVSCSDSRVPPELLFDQGLGDLFVVRTAGQVVGELELGSIEYAVEHLGASLILVLGHERCGAVEATIRGGALPPDIEAIAARIRPAVEAARKLPGDLLDNAVEANVRLVLASLMESEIVAEAVHARHLALKAARYDLDDGEVLALRETGSAR